MHKIAHLVERQYFICHSCINSVFGIPSIALGDFIRYKFKLGDPVQVSVHKAHRYQTSWFFVWPTDNNVLIF